MIAIIAILAAFLPALAKSKENQGILHEQSPPDDDRLEDPDDYGDLLLASLVDNTIGAKSGSWVDAISAWGCRRRDPSATSPGPLIPYIGKNSKFGSAL